MSVHEPLKTVVLDPGEFYFGGGHTRIGITT